MGGWRRRGSRRFSSEPKERRHTAWKSVENSTPSLINYANGRRAACLNFSPETRARPLAVARALALIIHRIITIITITAWTTLPPSLPPSLVSGSRDARNTSTPLDRPPPPPPPLLPPPLPSPPPRLGTLGRRQTASNLHVSQSVLFLYNTSDLFGVR